jgi:tetratricopeptide (TPR) repeat protein
MNPLEPATTAKRPWDLLGPGYERLDAGDQRSARAILEDAKRSFPTTPEVRLFEARVVEAESGAAQAIDLFRQAAIEIAAANEKAPSGGRMLALAQAYIKCADLEAASAALSAATRHGADSFGVLRLERAIASAQGDMPGMRRAAEAVVAAGGAKAHDFIALAIACRNLDDLDSAAAAAERILSLCPNHFGGAQVALSIALQRGDIETIVSAHRKLAALKPDDPQLTFLLIRYLALSGHVVEAGQALDAALARWPRDPRLRAFALITGLRSVREIPEGSVGATSDIDVQREGQIRRLARDAPPDGALRRPLIIEDNMREVVVVRSERSQLGALVFTDLTDSLSVPLAIFDRYLAALGVNAIYLRDFRRSFYLRGIASLGASYDGTVAELRKLCGEIGVQRLICIGAATGGFAAIRYGVDLGAERVLSFSAHTHSPDRDIDKMDRGVALIRRRLAVSVTEPELDLASFLTPPRASTRIELFYPKDAPRDSEQANRLAGIDGVTLQPVAGCADPELIRWLALQQDMTALLAWYLPR